MLVWALIGTMGTVVLLINLLVMRKGMVEVSRKYNKLRENLAFLGSGGSGEMGDYMLCLSVKVDGRTYKYYGVSDVERVSEYGIDFNQRGHALKVRGGYTIDAWRTFLCKRPKRTEIRKE